MKPLPRYRAEVYSFTALIGHVSPTREPWSWVAREPWSWVVRDHGVATAAGSAVSQQAAMSIVCALLRDLAGR